MRHRAELELRLAATSTTGVAESLAGPVQGSALITLARVCRRRGVPWGMKRRHRQSCRLCQNMLVALGRSSSLRLWLTQATRPNP